MTLLSPSRAVLQAVAVAAMRLRGPVAALAVTGLLAACSSLPDELNPVEWVGALDSDGAAEESPDPEMAARIEAERAAGIPGEDEAFPSLGEVPSEAPVVTSYDARQDIAEGLIADRNTAQYTDNPAAAAAAAVGVAAAPPPMVSQEANLVAPPPPAGLQVPARVAEIESVPAAVEVPLADSPGPVREAPPASQPMPMPETMMADAAVAEAPALSGLDIGAVPRSLHAGVIYFGHGSIGLSPRDKQVLGEIAAAHRARGGSVRLVGHASRRTDSGDPVKSKIANFAVAYDRARVVAEELVRQGVAADRIFISSMADQAPAYSEATDLGEAANRRTDVYLDFTAGGE